MYTNCADVNKEKLVDGDIALLSYKPNKHKSILVRLSNNRNKHSKEKLIP